MINDKTFEHRPITELLSIVKNDFKKFDSEGLIDDGVLIKTVLYCNDKLGLPIREIREIAVPVLDFKAELPKDFEKLYYVCALQVSNSMATVLTNPFDNNFDSDIIYEAELDRESLGCVENYQVVVKRQSNVTVHQHGSWVELEVQGPDRLCHIDCPNKRKKGKYGVVIKDGEIETPFKAGLLYIMYIGMMRDHEGEITFPFHPMITPYYEWTIKEKILTDAVFNSDLIQGGELLKLAQSERLKAWMDAYNFTLEKSYGEYTKMQRKKELGWYHQYFRYFK